MYGNAAEVCGLYGEETGVQPIDPTQQPKDHARFTGTAYPITFQIDPEYRDPPITWHTMLIFLVGFLLYQ